MDNTNVYEREIDLKDLMFAILHKWRIILVSAVLMALVLGGYKAASVYRAVYDEEAISDAQNKYERERKLYDQKVAAYERDITKLTEDIEKQEEYLESSILMNISPYDIWEAKIDFFVKTDYKIMPDMTYQNTDYTATVLQTYQSVLTDAVFMETVAKSSNTEARYLRELISVDVGRSDSGYNNLLRIQIRHGEEAKAQELMDEVIREVSRSGSRIRASIGDHTITEVNKSLGSVVDLTLADRQRNERDQLTALKDSLTEKQIQQQEDLEAQGEPELVTPSFGDVAKAGIKYGIVGGVLGIFVVIFFFCIRYIMSDRLSSAKEMRYRFPIKVLGTLPVGGMKKVSAFDKWLRKMEGYVYDKDKDLEYDLIAANIRNYGADIHTLLVTGGTGENRIENARQQLSQRLADIKIECAGNFFLNPESLKALAECDGVVLVEEKEVSVYNMIEMEIEKISDLNKKLIGCIVLE